MKKLLVLIMILMTYTNINAQVYYYVKAGSDPKSSADCIVLRWEDSGRKVLIFKNMASQIKTCLMEDTNYFENIKISDKWGCINKCGVYRYYNFKNSQSDMNIFISSDLIHKGSYSPPIIVNGKVISKEVNFEPIYNHYYFALSYDKENLIDNPIEDLYNKTKYYKRVPKSTFEFQGMNF